MPKHNRFDKAITLCVFIYIFWMFFYGLIIKFTIFNSTLFFLKTYVTDAVLVLIIVFSLAKKSRLTKNQFFFIAYMIVVVALNLTVHGFSDDSITGLLYTVRGFIAPMIAAYCMLNVSIDRKHIDKLFDFLFAISILFLVSNTLLSYLQARNGYQWASQFYTGYSFYGKDAYSKLRITMSRGMLRAPGISGGFTSSAMYSLISLALILTKSKNRLTKLVFILLAAISIGLTYNKTVIILFAIVLIMHLFSRMPHTFRYMLFLSMGGLLLLAFIVVVSQAGIITDESGLTFSTLARVEFWTSIGDVVSPLEVIVPYNMLEYAANGEGMLACWDNFYLYALFAFGIYGLYLFIDLSRKIVKVNIKKSSYNYNFYIYLAIMFFLAAIFNNVSNGKSFLGIFMLLNGAIWKFNNEQRNEKSEQL